MIVFLGYLAAGGAAEQPASPGVPPPLALPLGLRDPERTFRQAEHEAQILESIRRGLDWLASAQSKDGSWESARHAGQPGHDVGVTALALLAFLGAGYADRGGHAYAGAVERGVRYLASRQEADGCLGPREPSNWFWDHVTATIALLEGVALTEDPGWTERAGRAMEFIRRAQNPYFAWRYGVKPGDNDMAVTGWVAVAIRANDRIVELGPKSPHPVLVVDLAMRDGLVTWVSKMTDAGTGRVGYIQRGAGPSRYPGVHDRAFPRDASEACTAAAILARQAAGVDLAKDEMTAKGFSWILRTPPLWEPRRLDLWYWMLGAMAFEARRSADPIGKRAPLSPWEKTLVASLLGDQLPDGSWAPEDAWSHVGGRVYSTAVALRALLAPNLDTRAADVSAPSLGPESPAHLRARWVASLADPAPAVDLVLHGLDSAGPADQIDRLRALRRLTSASPGASAVASSALRLLSSPDAPVRCEAARALGRLRITDATAAVRALLADPVVPVRVGAAEALVDLGARDAETMGALRLGLDHSDLDLRVATARALHSLGGLPDSAAPSLLDVARQGDSRQALAAAELLAEMGPAAATIAPGLAEDRFAKSSDLDLRRITFEIRARHAPDAALAEEVLAFFSEHTETHGAAALRIQRQLGPIAAPLLPRLVQSLSERTLRPDALAEWRLLVEGLRPIPRETIAALFSLWTKGQRAAADTGLRAADSAEYGPVLDALKGVVIAKPAQVDALAKHLEAADAFVRSAVLHAVGNLGPKASRATMAVLARLKDEDPAVRARAARVISQIDPKPIGTALKAVAESLTDAEPNVRAAAAMSLGAWGKKSASVLPALRAAQEKETAAEVRTALADAIDRITRVR